jgi:hypothetical protein
MCIRPAEMLCASRADGMKKRPFAGGRRKNHRWRYCSTGGAGKEEGMNKVAAVGYALRAAERIHLADWQAERLMAAMEQEMADMLDSDAEEVFERYDRHRQAEAAEIHRIEEEELQQQLDKETNFERKVPA